MLRGTQNIAHILTANADIYSQINSVKLMLDLDSQDVETSTMVIQKETVTPSTVLS